MSRSNRRPAAARASALRRVASRTLTGTAVVATTLALAACQSAVLDPKGPVGRANRIILVDSLVIMLAIVVPVIVALGLFAWWFRASNPKARYLPDWEFSGAIELVVWSIPLMTILLLSGVIWIGSHQIDPAEPLAGDSPLEVDAVSLDWKWLFIYPEQRIATVNELVVPAGRPLHFRLTSSSVMNTFFVPELGSMIYTMNGMTTDLWLQSDEPGTFRGMSAHYSGDGFSDMNFPVRALAADGFAHWVSGVRDGGGNLDAKRYAALAVQSIAEPRAAFAAVDRDLFARVAAGDLKPGPGPALDHGDAVEATAGKKD